MIEITPAKLPKKIATTATLQRCMKNYVIRYYKYKRRKALHLPPFQLYSAVRIAIISNELPGNS